MKGKGKGMGVCTVIRLNEIDENFSELSSTSTVLFHLKMDDKLISSYELFDFSAIFFNESFECIKDRHDDNNMTIYVGCYKHRIHTIFLTALVSLIYLY
jgi:hypothetical protein